MIKKDNRGGAREGAGRKKMLDCEKKKRVTYALSPDVIAFLNNHRPAAQTLERAVRELAASMDKASSTASQFEAAYAKKPGDDK
ncbi:MAG: hypothetical protein LV471_09250 [Nitrosomonas sp.]|nr:hypothetical protein [Nitrosomonas sp.]